MYEVMQGLGRADIGIDQWFDHKYLSVYTRFGVGDKVEGYKNVRYPLLDLGYFNNTNNKIGYFDLRASFNLWTMCLAIAKKIDKSLTFQGALPERLQKTYITPKDWKYSDRLIQVNKSEIVLPEYVNESLNIDVPIFRSDPLTGTKLPSLLLPVQSKAGIFEGVSTQTISAPFTTTTLVNSNFTFGVNFEFAMNFKFRVVDLKYNTMGGFPQWAGFELDVDLKNGLTGELIAELLPDWSSGFSSVDTFGIAPEVSIDGNKIFIKAYANQATYSPYGNTDVFATVQVKFSGFKVLPTGSNLTFTINETRWGLNYPACGACTQPPVDLYFSFFSPTPEKYITVTHDERIYPRGIISGADLMGSLKPADILKYAMRLTGSYLVENDTSLTLVPFSDYDKATAMDWSGKVNWLIPPIVDYRDNELGKNNYLIYKQDDTNTPLDPYYLAGNLPTNLGEKDVTLYEAPFAQSAFNQTFQGTLSLVRVPYYDALLAYVYKVWINDSTSFTKGQYVGYEGRLFKILNNVLGSAGTPLTLTNDYEEVDFSVFNNQSPEFRVIEVLTDQVTGVQVYDNLLDSFYTKQDVGALNGIDFQKAITDGYGFIPSTFLDYRQVVCQVSLSDLDIHLLDLKKLVFISELNAYFYINKVEDYTPDTNVDTTVTLTMLP